MHQLLMKAWDILQKSEHLWFGEAVAGKPPALFFFTAVINHMTTGGGVSGTGARKYDDASGLLGAHQTPRTPSGTARTRALVR